MIIIRLFNDAVSRSQSGQINKTHKKPIRIADNMACFNRFLQNVSLVPCHYTNLIETAVKWKVNLTPPLIKHHAMKTYCNSRGKAPLILNLSNRWRWVVSCTSRPFYPRYPLDWRLYGPQSWSKRRGEEKKSIIVPTGSWTLVVRPVAQSRYSLSYPSSNGQ
jgi:hypothetical protein